MNQLEIKQKITFILEIFNKFLWLLVTEYPKISLLTPCNSPTKIVKLFYIFVLDFTENYPLFITGFNIFYLYCLLGIKCKKVILNDIKHSFIYFIFGLVLCKEGESGISVHCLEVIMYSHQCSPIRKVTRVTSPISRAS